MGIPQLFYVQTYNKITKKIKWFKQRAGAATIVLHMMAVEMKKKQYFIIYSQKLTFDELNL